MSVLTSTTPPATSPKVSIWKQFPGSFWAANVMEIFERMGWYGFYAVCSLYLTGAVADGGLGLSSEDRGVIQGAGHLLPLPVPRGLRRPGRPLRLQEHVPGLLRW